MERHWKIILGGGTAAVALQATATSLFLISAAADEKRLDINYPTTSGTETAHFLCSDKNSNSDSARTILAETFKRHGYEPPLPGLGLNVSSHCNLMSPER
jgi:hypothetical protein